MIRIRHSLSILGVLILGLGLSHAATEGTEDDGPYTGQIREDAVEGDTVALNKPLIVRDRTRLTGDQICGYTVYKSHSELPFKVLLTNQASGAAKLVIAPGYTLDYERVRQYVFEIAAHDCVTGTHTDRKEVRINIVDVNEHSPVWSQDTYIAEVQESRLYDQIIQLEALDRDGSDMFSDICHYHVLTPDVPFTVDQDGYLKNTEPLNYNIKHNFILKVKAEDCGGRESEVILVNIQVTEACKSGWKGLQQRVDYLPSSGPKVIAPKAALSVCDPTCKASSVLAKISLETDHIGKGCDRDTYSIQSQRKLCGASSGSVDLLPNPKLGSWTETLPTDDGLESDQIFSFDGKTNAIEIPENKFNPHLSPHFTISTWMKHEENTEDPLMKGTKEHILCHADGEKMNRHHYSVFVHNCKLVLLMRQEPDEGIDMNTFKPAEWRWKMPQVCDDEWHHYAVSVDFPDVRMYVDGKHFIAEKQDPLIVDDWPLHKAKIGFTKLVVGACWQGGEKHMSQYFRGYLAGLSVLDGKTESDRVLACLNNCQEKLDFHAMDEMDTGMTISMNSEMTDITITGSNKTDVEHLLHRVAYVNSRMFPTPGHRSLVLHTEITCSDGKKVDTADVNLVMMVLQAENPIITLTAQQTKTHEERDVGHGVRPFLDIVILSRTRKEQQEEDEDEDELEVTDERSHEKSDAASKYQLDSCTVHVDPPMNPALETLSYPDRLLAQLGLEASASPDGLVVAGADRIYNYEQVLREVHYAHHAPEAINARTFTVSCMELNGRFVSNELVIKVEIVHVKHEEVAVPVAQGEAKLMQPVKNFYDVKSLKNSNTLNKDGHTSAGMIVIIVVCVGFLGFMIILGIIRIRSAHNRTTTHTHEVAVDGEKAEMEWDNSALTITVNPMDQETVYEDEHEINGLRGEESDSDEEEIDSDHDDLESSEEEAEKVKDRELEWDDSTLTF